MPTTQRYWREIPQRYRLEASKCTKCGKVYFPPRVVCSGCRNKEFETVRLSDKGKVISFTVIRTPPSQFKDLSPYALGLIELDGGGFLVAGLIQIVNGRSYDAILMRTDAEGRVSE